MMPRLVICYIAGDGCLLYTVKFRNKPLLCLQSYPNYTITRINTYIMLK